MVKLNLSYSIKFIAPKKLLKTNFFLFLVGFTTFQLLIRNYLNWEKRLLQLIS